MTESRSVFELVFFDVDSTLVRLEGIDYLAAGNSDVVRLTNAAMNGDLSVEEVYAQRLELIRPTRGQIELLGQVYIQSLIPDAAEVIATLRQQGSDVHLVTAGIEQAIIPLADHLGLSRRVVHAVRLSFDESGSYVDFDRNSPLTRSGGKDLVVRNIRARNHGRAAFVGDGVTDLEARAAVDLFIGFGGVTIRERVRELADHYIDGPMLRPILPLLTRDLHDR